MSIISIFFNKNRHFLLNIYLCIYLYPKNKYSNFQFIKYFNSFQDKLPVEFASEKFLSLDTEFAIIPSYVGDKIDFLIFRSIYDNSICNCCFNCYGFFSFKGRTI